jgi:hypothetical protein
MTSPVLAKIYDNPISKSLYQNLLEKLGNLGPHKVEPKQTSLHITNGKRAFLGVYARSNGLLLSIVGDHMLTSPRFKKVEQLSKSRYHYDILITEQNDIDSELMKWIEASYRL